MQRCPLEIWQGILDHLVHDGETGAISTMSLLFRAFTPIAQAELFRCVSLRMGNYERCETFRNIIRHNPLLATFVETLEINVYYDPWNPRKGHWLFLPTSLEVASSLAHISRLSLRSSGFAETNTKDFMSYFSIYTSVQSLNIQYCTFNTIEDMHALLMCFQSSLRRLEMHEVGWYPDVEDTRSRPKTSEVCRALHAISYNSWRLESSEISEVHIPYLTAWLLCSGAVSGLRTLELEIADNIDARDASDFFSHGCKSLQRLVLRFNSIYWRDARDSATIELSELSHLESLRVVHVTDDTWACLLSMLLTLPKENAMDEITLSVIGIYGTHEFWKESLSRLDRIIAHGCLLNLTYFEINVPFSGHGSRVGLTERAMPLTKDKGILHITLED